MGKAAKSGDMAYPPRGMRLDRAAAYLDMSPSSFLRLVDEGTIAPGVQVKGMVIWDRRDLDAAFENLKDAKRRPRNSADVALGINTDGTDEN